jgi:hypothetical protein
MKITEIAEKIQGDFIALNNSNSEENLNLDPAVLLLIVEIAVQIINLYQDCGKDDAEAAGMANKPSVFQRALLRRIVRNNLGNAEYRRYGDDLVNAFISQGRNIDPESMGAMFEEANSI